MPVVFLSKSADRFESASTSSPLQQDQRRNKKNRCHERADFTFWYAPKLFNRVPQQVRTGVTTISRPSSSLAAVDLQLCVA